MFQNLEFNSQQSLVSSPWPARVCALAVSIFTLALITIVLTSETADPIIPMLAYEKLPSSGVENPVTAVLLNYRSYDTLLEIAVLLIAALAVLPGLPRPGSNYRIITQGTQPIGPVLQRFLSWLIPLTVITSGYILWTGAYAPGGAFQAGTLLAGVGILLVLTDGQRFYLTGLGARWLLPLGLWVFIVVALAVPGLGGKLLQYPSNSAGIWILLIEGAVTLSIAGILWLLFYALASEKAS